MRRPLHLEDGVADLLPESRQLLLQLRLVVDVCGGCVVDPPGERLDDRVLDRLEAVLQEERPQSRFEQRGEDVAIARQPLELLRRNDALTPVREPSAQTELARYDRAARAGDDMRPNLRQPALRKIRKPLEERVCDGELEDAVPEKLEPLVGGRPVGRPRGVRERIGRPLRGQLVDQPRKTAGLPVRGLATGAT